MILGFTGSRHEPTDEQKRFLIRVHIWDAAELHHGCCVGSDYAAHNCAVSIKGQPTIWLHPPTDEKLMVPMSKLLTRGGIHALNQSAVKAAMTSAGSLSAEAVANARAWSLIVEWVHRHRLSPPWSIGLISPENSMFWIVNSKIGRLDR